MNDNGAVLIDYTNWRGERRKRYVIPIAIRATATKHHPEKQWILKAIDCEKKVGEDNIKYFALRDIHAFDLKETCKDDDSNAGDDTRHATDNRKLSDVQLRAEAKSKLPKGRSSK